MIGMGSIVLFAVITAISDGMKSCGERVKGSWLRGYFDTLIKGRACLLVAMITGGNSFYSSE